MEPTPLALEGGVLITEPPEESPHVTFKREKSSSLRESAKGWGYVVCMPGFEGVRREGLSKGEPVI